MRNLHAKPIVRYHGGKWRIANWIIKMTQLHPLTNTTFRRTL